MRRMMRRLHVTLFRYESPWWGACCGLAATTESRNQPQGRKKLCERGTPPAGTPVFRDGLRARPDGDALEAPGPPIDQRASTMWVACSVGTFSVTRKPRPGRSMPANRDSPRPRTTGDSARCNSSIAPASRYWRIVETPPPIFTSRSPAAALAWASAASIPSVTKWKVVPPSITTPLFSGSQTLHAFVVWLSFPGIILAVARIWLSRHGDYILRDAASQELKLGTARIWADAPGRHV